jgi:O-acetyl-ADP-ribose deacetylase (regulator of RNase III)
MIKEVSGDILLSEAHAIAHGVAPNDHFNSGLALAMRERWPALAKDFRHYCQTSHPQPGALFTWMGADGKYVVNLMTQAAAYGHGEKPGRATTEAVGHALRELAKFAKAEKLRSIALPRLATGVGGLEWAEVKPLIERHLGGLDLPVYIYTTYSKGQKAAEH